MHNLIVPAHPGMVTDHRDGDGLNNRRANLRICTDAENKRNRKVPATTHTGYKGVTYRKQYGTYEAFIKVKGKSLQLGTFTNPVLAAQAYDSAALLYFGEFARLNFPQTTI